jgi:hypothetical protein
VNNTPDQKQQVVPTASTIIDDGIIVEMVYRPEQRRTAFAIFDAGRWTLQEGIETRSGVRLVPFSPNNNSIRNDVVLFPSEPCTYDTEAQLVAEIQEFIHRYVDFDAAFEKVATYYVILTWLYDAFNELPYLRLRGDYGSGKTRALLTVGSLCYRGFFASGASTVSPIFHTLNAFTRSPIVTLLISDVAGPLRFTGTKASSRSISRTEPRSTFPVVSRPSSPPN